MKPTNPGSRRQKIILYYTLAVVLPGIILGYMAYRGIRNDQALREKESRRKLEIGSQTFFTAIDLSLIQFMNEQTADSMLPSSRQGDPSLLALFVKDTGGSKRLITHKLLYLPAELLNVQPEQLSPPANLKEGLRLEFIGRRFSEALRFYQDKTLKTTNPTEKIQALVASARLYNKMNQPDRAKVKSFEKIRDFIEYLSENTKDCYRDIRSISTAYKHLYTADIWTVASPGVIESISFLGKKSEIKTIAEEWTEDSDANDIKSKVVYTRKDGQQIDFLPTLETVVRFWDKLLYKEDH